MSPNVTKIERTNIKPMVANKLRSLHHYVPQFYLRNFASRSRGNKFYIFTYEKNKPIYEPCIENTASEKGFYNTQRSDTLEETDMIEEVFATIESVIAPILKNIIKNKDINLSDKDRAELDYFFALLYARTPDFRKQQAELYKQYAKQLVKTAATDKKLFSDNLKKAGVDISIEESEELRSKTLNFDDNFKLDLEGGQSGFIKTALELAGDFAPCFYMKHLHLVEMKGGKVFVTSDNPIILLPQDNLCGKGLLNSTIIVPVAPTLCLVYHIDQNKKNIFAVSEKQVDRINKCTMSSANRFVYANLSSKTIARHYGNAEDIKKVTTKSFLAPKSSLLVTSHEIGPYLLKDIFPSLDVIGS